MLKLLFSSNKHYKSSPPPSYSFIASERIDHKFKTEFTDTQDY